MKKTKLNWDKINSTYMWIIDLDKNHPANYSQKTDKLFGYSKVIGSDEPKDKFQLLMTKALMFYNKDYLLKSTCIHFFIKQGAFMDMVNQVEIIRFYKEECVINPICEKNPDFYNKYFIRGGIRAFLDKFYQNIKSRRKMSDLKPKSKKFITPDESLSIDLVKLTSKEQLFEYCKKLIGLGYSIEDVATFKKQYEEKHFK